FDNKRQAGVHHDGECNLELHLCASSELEGGEENGRHQEIPDQNYHRIAVGEITEASCLLLHLPVSVLGRQLLHACCTFGRHLQLVLGHFAEANLLIHNVDEKQGAQRHQQKWKPPTCTSP